MKDKILKLSGHKDLKSFYKEFPDEASFMAKYGKKIQKLQKAEGGFEQLLKPMQGKNIPTGNPFENLDINSLVSTKEDNSGEGIAKVMSTMGSVPKAIGEGIANIIKEGKQRRKAQMWSRVSDVALQASQLKPEEQERKYVRPEDVINSGEEFFPIYGVGTSPLAKNGKKLKKAKFGAEEILNAGGADFLTQGTDALFQDNAGYGLGKSIGSAVKMIPGVGPIVSSVAEPVLGTIGGLLDPNQKKIRRAKQHMNSNILKMGMGQNMQGVQQQYSSFMKNGGELPELDDYAFGGELRVYNGEAEPISYNPYTESETIMFKGPSHENGGMPIKYGNSPVEVEGGEPAIKMKDGGNADSLVVFGNLQIPNGMLQDPNAKGKKFKNYIADLAKVENKANKIMNNSLKMIDEVGVNTSLDKLKLSSLKANILGSEMKLKDAANKKEQAANVQNAINQTAEEQGIIADDLAKGKITKAKYGKTIGKEDRKKLRQIDNLPTFDIEDPYTFNGETGEYEEAPSSKFDWEELLGKGMTTAKSILPILRPSDAEDIDPRQYAAELTALTDQVEPVYAQTRQPKFLTPQSISLQDVMNENTADYRATQNMLANNPAVLAMLNAQKYAANQKVLGEQFRMNQAERQRVAETNRLIQDEVEKQNLQILDTQQYRQALAKSKTKEQLHNALKSISEKMVMSDMEKKFGQIEENRYNYRFDEKGRAINMNAPYEFNIPQAGSTSTDTKGIISIGGQKYRPIDYDNKTGTPTKFEKVRNGAIVKALKNF